MADLFHWFGNDLQVDPSGDLLTVEGTVKGQQSIVRRLLTAAFGYIFEITYGAGLSAFIGTPTALAAVEGVIRSQLYLEFRCSANAGSDRDGYADCRRVERRYSICGFPNRGSGCPQFQCERLI